MKTCTWIFIEVLFIIAQNVPNVSWIYPKCPSLAQWVNERWYIRTMGYFSVVTSSSLLNPVKTQIRLKCIMPSERSQVHKATYHRNRLTWHPGKYKIGTESKSVISRGWGTVDDKELERIRGIMELFSDCVDYTTGCVCHKVRFYTM